MTTSLSSPTAGAGTALRPVTPVGLLTARLETLDALLADEPGLDPGVRRVLDEARALAGGLDPYLEQCTSPESPALARLAGLTRAADWGGPDSGRGGLEAEMLSGHVEGQLLKLLVHATQARQVLEIGMFTGYSALAMAEALPPDGRVVACEIDSGVAQFAERCFAESSPGRRIEVRVGPACDTLAELAAAGERFDLVFVDADKPGYLGYLHTLLDEDLLSPHALVCVDNTLMQGQPWVGSDQTANGAAIAAFNRAVALDERVEQVLLPVRDGLTLIRRTRPSDDGGSTRRRGATDS